MPKISVYEMLLPALLTWVPKAIKLLHCGMNGRPRSDPQQVLYRQHKCHRPELTTFDTEQEFQCR